MLLLAPGWDRIMFECSKYRNMLQCVLAYLYALSKTLFMRPVMTPVISFRFTSKPRTYCRRRRYWGHVGLQSSLLQSCTLIHPRGAFFIRIKISFWTLYTYWAYIRVCTRVSVCFQTLESQFYFHRRCIHVHYTSELQGVPSKSPLILIYCVFRGPSDHVLVSWAVKG